jgi:hypothetical protein
VQTVALVAALAAGIVGTTWGLLAAREAAARLTQPNLAQRFPDQLEVRAPILRTVGNAYVAIGEYGRSVETWWRKWLKVLREQHGADSVPFALEQTMLAINLLAQKRSAEAEQVLREALVPLQRDMSDSWLVCNAKSLLGCALLQQKRYAEARPLLVEGYEGIKARLDTMPPQARARATEALERLVQLHEAENRAADAARCRAELDELKRMLAPAKP